MEYRAIAKSNGYVYAHANRLYKRMRTVGPMKYLKYIKMDVELTDFAFLCAVVFATKRASKFIQC